MTVGFSGTDTVSGTDSCSGVESYAGPDSGQAVIGGTCVDKAGNVGLASLAVSYDATAPIVTGAEPARGPDANGWYNHSLVVGFRGSDATSGIAGCTQTTYAGPDSLAANVTGSCSDYAGNSAGSLPFGLRFDSTAPAIGQLRVKPGNGSATLSWTASADTTLVEIRRGTKRIYSGTGNTFTDKGLTNGTSYRYTLTSFDEAANSSTSAAAAKPSGPLASPAANAVVTAPPRLAWKPVPGATYYHVQLWRQRTDPERLAARHVVPAPPQLGLQRTPLPPRAGAVPVVRLARTWPPRAEELRPVARLELVPRALARSQNARRQGQEDHVGENEHEERQAADHQHRVGRGRLLA